ncbi:MAG: hypothetical protein EA396_00750 [Anaerolineaceae bacterium]|nr:MAG: hypothetical protein EA396_00750 [Anaerolineaceae bacterium]
MTDQLDAILSKAAKTVAPAITLHVIHRGQTRHQSAWGTAEADTLFDLASLTKLFTVTAFLCAIGDRPLQTPLVEIVPEFGMQSPRPIEGAQDPHTRERGEVPDHLRGVQVDPADVTLWHLLTHTSGLPAWRDVFNTSSPPPPPASIDMIPRTERWRYGLKAMCAYPFVDQVGATVIYSDIGMMLLGEVVARLHGESLADAIRDHVTAPLGLERVLFDPVRVHGVNPSHIATTEYDASWRQRRVWGEVHDENACGLGGVAGHAGLFGTSADVAAFGEAWRTQSGFNISSADWAQATRQQAASGAHIHGLGWMLPSSTDSSAGDRISRAAFGHTGFTGTSLWIDRERELVVALLTNSVHHGRGKTDIHGLRRAVHDAVIAEIEA